MLVFDRCYLEGERGVRDRRDGRRSSEFSKGVRVDLIRLVCLVQPNKPNRQKKQEKPSGPRFRGLTSSSAHGTGAPLFGQSILTLRPSLKGHHHEKRGDDRRRNNVDDQNRYVQRVRTLCIRKNDHHCLNGGECNHSKPRGEGRAKRVPEKVTRTAPRQLCLTS